MWVYEDSPPAATQTLSVLEIWWEGVEGSPRGLSPEGLHISG